LYPSADIEPALCDFASTRAIKIDVMLVLDELNLASHVSVEHAKAHYMSVVNDTMFDCVGRVFFDDEEELAKLRAFDQHTTPYSAVFTRTDYEKVLVLVIFCFHVIIIIIRI
jgi:hypothetical protein